MVIASVIVSVVTLDALQLLTPEMHGRVLPRLSKWPEDSAGSEPVASPLFSCEKYQPHQGVVAIGTGRLAEKRNIRRRRSDAASQVR